MPEHWFQNNPKTSFSFRQENTPLTRIFAQFHIKFDPLILLERIQKQNKKHPFFKSMLLDF